MAYLEPRKNVHGAITSYRIVISDGYDSGGNQVRRRFLWTPTKPGMKPQQMEKEAMAAAFKYEEQVRNGFRLDNNQTFAEYANYVIDLKERAGVRPTTLDRYVEMLPRINQAIGHIQLVKLRPQHLNDFYKDLSENSVRKDKVRAYSQRALRNLLEELDVPNAAVAREAGLSGSTVTNAVRGDPIRLDSAEKIAQVLNCDFDALFKIQDEKKPLAAKTVLEHHRLISTILHQAEKEMLVTYNAAAKATPPKATRPTPEYYQPDEMDKILEALENAPIKWKAITYLMIDTGCRRGEVMGLKWESVNLETGLIVIENTLLYTKSQGTYTGTTKTGKVRAMKLAPQSLEVLKKWQKEQLRLRLLNGDAWMDTGFVFTRDDGKWLHPDSITDWLSNFSKENNLPHIHPHAFRHTAASTMIANGVDLVTTANEMGHANATTTAMIYAHQIAIAQARAAEVRAGVFAGRDKKSRRRRA